MLLPEPQVHLIHENQNFRVYPQRFWVLFVFVFLSLNQCMFWLTFSPIALHTEAYYKVSEATVDLVLNWGPIIFLPTLPLTYLLLNTLHGLRKCVLTYAVVSLLATLTRLIPSVVTSPLTPHFHGISVPFLHVGQILIAATGPFGMALVSQLSCLWFAPHERTRATTAAILGPNIGAAVAFLISPHLVSSAERVPHLLYLHAAQALVACVCALIYFPAEPPSPPSVAAHLLLARPATEGRLIATLERLVLDIVHCCRDPSFVLLVISGALMGGTLTAWAGLFATILTPIGYTQIQAGWFGFGMSISGIIGAFVMSYLADRPRFQRSLKLLMLVALISSFICCLFFQLSIRTLFWPDNPPLKSSVVSVGIILSITGFFNGAGSPLTYECLAEMMHPLPESLSASLLVLLFNIMSLVFLAIAPNRAKLMNLLVLLIMAIAITMVACARVTYRRKDEELRKIREGEYTVAKNDSLKSAHSGQDGNI